jgi:DNA-binding protein H-NS
MECNPPENIYGIYRNMAKRQRMQRLLAPSQKHQYIPDLCTIQNTLARTSGKIRAIAYCAAGETQIKSAHNTSFNMPPTRTKGARGKKMATVNYDKMSLKELLDHEARLAKAIVAARRNEFTTARQKVIAMAESLGYKIEDLAGSGRAGKRGNGGKVAVKFRNKDNPEETWTGRGRQPKWLTAKLAKGSKLSDFAI